MEKNIPIKINLFWSMEKSLKRVLVTGEYIIEKV